MFHKKVELTELFFDLVFVYAISQMTALIHHLHHGAVSLTAFLSFLMALLVSINTWMIQTVFTNRYGQNSFVNIGFMLVNMAQILALSNTFTTDWTNGHTFYTFSLLVVGLTAVLFFQYLYEYFRVTDEKNKSLIRFFLGMLFMRCFLLTISLLLPLFLAMTAFILVVLITTLSPIFYTKRMTEVPTNFPHLSERLSLLVIITFGEMLIGIAPYFTAEDFSVSSLLVFLTVVSLFVFYIIEMDHFLNEEKEKVTGNAMIYFHYFIFIGLSMVTVSLSFLREAEVHFPFLTLFLYAGLFLFYLGTLLNGIYNKSNYRFTRPFLILNGFLLGIACLASGLLGANMSAQTLIVTLTALLLTIHSLCFYAQKS